MAKKRSLDQLEEQIQKLKQQAEQTRKEQHERERKQQERKEMLIGRLLYPEIREQPDGDLARKVQDRAATQLTGKMDRALFGLEPLPSKKKARPPEKKSGEDAGLPDDDTAETSASVSDEGALKNLFSGKDSASSGK